MIWYILFTALTIGLCGLYERRRDWRWLMPLAAVPLTLVAALRWNVGTDFRLTYLPEYRVAEALHGASRPPEKVKEFRRLAKKVRFGRTPAKVQRHFTRALERSEPFHRALMHGAASAGLGFRPVAAVYALLTAVCVFFAIFRFSRWPSLAAFLYVATGNYFLGLNVMRQYLAVGIGLAALAFVLDRRPWRFLLAVAVASCCHYSALVLLPAYALSRVTLTPRRAATLVAVALAVSFAAAPGGRWLLTHVNVGEYARYFDSQLAEDGFEWIFFSVNLCFLAMGAWYWQRASAQSRWFALWYGMTALGTAALALSAFVPLMKRINYYYAAPQFLLLPEMLLAEANPRRRRILTALVILAFVAETAVSVCICNKNGVLPYRIH